MKKALLLILFVSLNSIAQNSYFIDTKGKETLVKDGEWDILLRDKRVSYKLPGKTWEKYVKFDDLDYAVFGSYKLKSYKINKRRKVYFVMAESDGKSLLSMSVTTTVTSGSMSSSNTYYEVLVVDANSNVLASLDFHDYKNKPAAEARGQLPGMIKTQFPNCSNILEALDAANTQDDANMGVLDFLNSPVYRSCE